jgi:hypothetical protein
MIVKDQGPAQGGLEISQVTSGISFSSPAIAVGYVQTGWHTKGTAVEVDNMGHDNSVLENTTKILTVGSKSMHIIHKPCSILL